MSTTPDLPSPSDVFIQLVVALTQSPDESLPPDLLSTAVALRHRFLSLAPSNPAYLQSQPSAALTDLLEAFSTLSPVFNASSAQWKLEPDESGSSVVVYRSCLVTSEERPNEGMRIIVVYAEAGWKYFDLTVEDEGWCDSYSEAHQVLNKRLQIAQEGLDDYWGDGVAVTQTEEEDAGDYWDEEPRQVPQVAPTPDTTALKATLSGLLRMYIGDCSGSEAAAKKFQFVQAVSEVVNIDSAQG